MEQYELAIKRAYGDLRFCLKNLKPEKLFVRYRGSLGGQIVINEDLEDKTLGVKRVKQSLSLILNDQETFFFDFDFLGRRFSLEYERVNRDGSRLCLSTGINPDDPSLPIPIYSIFRSANMKYLLEISFPGKIPLEAHSWFNEKDGWKYWRVDRKELKNMIGVA